MKWSFKYLSMLEIPLETIGSTESWSQFFLKVVESDAYV